MPRRTRLLGAVGHGAHGPARPVGALRQPAARRRPAEEPAVLRRPDRELEPDALVAREQRQEPVRRRRPDDLELARGLEGAERRHEVAVHRLEQPAEPGQALAPVRDQRQEMAVARLGERGRRLVAGGEPLLEEGLHLAHEHRARELVGQDRREADGDGSRGRLVAQLPERLQQGQVGVERRLADPVTAVRPPPMVQHVGQVAVQRQHEVHRGSGHRAAEYASARR